MNKRNVFSKMILLLSIASCALLFSCGKSDKQVEFKGEIVTFKEVDGDKIEEGLPYQDKYLVDSKNQRLDRVIKYAYANATTDIETKESHEVKIKYGIGDELYNHIKKYENEVELYDKSQQLKLTIYRISYPNHMYFEVARFIAKCPYYNKELTGSDWPSGTTFKDLYKRDVIYTETNTLEYYFSASFKYGSLEITDNITKDDLKPVILDNTRKGFGILQYSFVLEPVNENDEIIKYCRRATQFGKAESVTKNGYENIEMHEGDYVFPVAELVDGNGGKRVVNHPALRMLPSSLNNSISYVIDGNNVTFYVSKEVY